MKSMCRARSISTRCDPPISATASSRRLLASSFARLSSRTTSRRRPMKRNITELGLSAEDYKIAMRYLHEPRDADLIIAPDGKPYLYRWHLQSGDKGPGMY